jgi:hypothetical protein
MGKFLFFLFMLNLNKPILLKFGGQKYEEANNEKNIKK